MSTPDRDAILRRFAERLDAALAPERPPAGIPEEILSNATEPPGGDLHAIAAALTALTQEIKLQGRSFKQLAETLAPALEPVLEQARAAARRQVLDLLLDLRDRLLRGHETARRAAASVPPKRWWHRPESPRGAAIISALEEGYDLTLRRLDEDLAAFGVREIEALNRAFDARRMDAVGVEYTNQVEEGTVVEVCRRGYEWNGEVYRPAQVRVARRPEEKAGSAV